MKIRKIKFQDLVPFIAFVAILLFFTIASYDGHTGTIKMLTLLNLHNILDQTMLTMVVASGALFVVSQGSIDLSVGVNLALSGVIGTYVATLTGVDFLLIPVSLIMGMIVGIFNGTIVSKFKVSSFMVTLSMLIGIRGLVNFIQTKIETQGLPGSLAFLNNAAVKIPLFILIVVIMAYVFEYTKTGRYGRAIGENETTTKFVGIPVSKIKISAFAISGLMAGLGAVFSIVTVGSTTQQMGVFLEIRVVMAIFLGGVLVTGGTSAKFFKILLGSFSIQIIVNGLAVIQKGDSYISQSVEGVLLLLILLVSALAANGSLLRKKVQLKDKDEKDEVVLT